MYSADFGEPRPGTRERPAFTEVRHPHEIPNDRPGYYVVRTEDGLFWGRYRVSCTWTGDYTGPMPCDEYGNTY